jgi:hypothetical protein
VEKELIVSIHPRDSFHEWRDRLIGKEGCWEDREDSKRGEGWSTGNFTIDGDDYGTRYFHALKTIPINPIVDGQEGGKSRITPYGNLYKRKLRSRTSRT